LLDMSGLAISLYSAPSEQSGSVFSLWSSPELYQKGMRFVQVISTEQLTFFF